VAASPSYLAARGEPKRLADLAKHDAIAVANVRAAQDRWPFGTGRSETTIAINARLVVSTVQAGLDAAIAGGGLVRPLAYQSAPLEAEGKLRRILRAHEPAPLPIHLIHPAGRYLAPKLRLFIDRAVASLRGRFDVEKP
jgi:DNA-binding transcriptional LysR family regulator